MLATGTTVGEPGSLYDTTFISVAASPSLYVAVANNGIIKASSDGIHWDKGPANRFKGLRSVIWTGSRFFAVGEKCTILSSPDGLNWSPQKVSSLGLVCFGSGSQLSSIAYSGSKYVAVGSAGGSTEAMLVFSSENGETWQDRNVGAFGYLFSVAWSGDRFLAVGSGSDLMHTSSILTSIDGTNWSEDSAGLGLLLTRVIWTGNKFYVTGDHGNVFSSGDGNSWKKLFVGDSVTLQSVTWTGSTLAVLGTDRHNHGKNFYSTDDSTWTTYTHSGLDTCFSLIWVNGRYIMGGRHGILRTSLDGFTWQDGVVKW